MTLTPEILFKFSNITADGGFGASPISLQFFASLASGTSSGQFDVLYAKARTITNSGTPDSIDLTGGGLIGPDYSAANFAKVGLLIIAHYSTVQTLTIGQGSNAFKSFMVGTTPGIVLPPAQSATIPSWFAICVTGATLFAVTAGTADLVQVATDGGSSIPYLALFMGRSV